MSSSLIWPLIYFSRLVAGGRSCNRQSVFLSTEESSKNNWVIDAYDPLMRLEYEDGPVPHGTSLIIKHGLTGQVTPDRTSPSLFENPAQNSNLVSLCRRKGSAYSIWLGERCERCNNSKNAPKL